MSDRLTVWWNGRIAGSVRLDHHGDMTFAYSQTWLENADGSALSFSLPKREQPFGRRECQPFFEGLLPEGEQRSALAKALGLSAGNEFRLLERLGGEIAGAVTLWPKGQIPPISGSGTPHILDDENLLRLLRRLPSRPMLAGEGDLRLALAGAQSKLPVLLVDGNIALPAPGQPTSHILKPAIPRFEQTVDNEYYCLSLARAIGLDVAPVTMRHVDDRSFLLIERYDRTRGAGGQFVRLHQEDFAQALGVRSERKYASDGGPTFKDSFALLRQAITHPARAISKLTDAAIFNLVIGNADAHAKNFSLLHIDGTIRLAPLYDLLSTVAYPELSTKLAMRIGRKATLEEIEPRHWDRFAADVCIDGFHLQRRVRLLCEAILAQLNAPDSRLNQMLPDGARFIRFADLIGNRANRLLIKTGSRDTIRALAELVWNALDADAKRIEVILDRNDLGGLSGIRVIDNGSGISAESAEHDFGNLGDSWKRGAHRTSQLNRAIHGKEGRGRLRFFSLAQRARWITTSRSEAGFTSRTIEIHSKSLERCEVNELEEPLAAETGTTVHLTMLKDTFDALSTPDSYRQFSTLFAPYVLQYPNAEIWYNKFKVDPDVTIHRWQDLPKLIVKLPNRTIDDLRVKVIEWKTASETRQIYFGGEDGIVLGSQPAHVTAPGFEFSAYAYSAFFQEVADQNLLELDALNAPDFSTVVSHIRESLSNYFRSRMSEQSLGVIQELKDQGAYPYDGEPKDEVERRERQVFDIATYAINMCFGVRSGTT